MVKMDFVRNKWLGKHQSPLCFPLLMYARQTWEWHVSQMGCLLGDDAGCLIISTRIFCNMSSLFCSHSVEAEENVSSTKQGHIMYLIAMWSTYQFTKIINHTPDTVSFIDRSANGRFFYQYSLHNLHFRTENEKSAMKMRTIPTFIVSVVFLFIVYLPDDSCLITMLPQNLTSILSKTINITYQHTAIARTVIRGECEINNECKLMKHFITFPTEEIFPVQTPRHEIQVWHCHSWIKFFRWLTGKEGSDQ